MHLGLSTYGPFLIYGGAIAAFVLSVLWKPQIGLYFLVPLLPMQTARYWVHQFPFGEKLVDILLLGVIVGLILHTKRPFLVSSPLNKIVVLLIVVTYFALWEGSFFTHAPLPIAIDDPRFSDWKNFVEMMLLFFITAAVIRQPKQMVIIVILMCVSVLVINRSYHGTVGGRDFSQYSDSLRDAGALGYAGENGMGAFQAEMAVFLMGLACYARKILPRVLLWGTAITCVYCLLLTFSRGGYLGFLAGLAVLGVTKNRKLLVAFFLILLSWQALVPNAVRERVLMTYQQNEGLDASVEERITIWQDAIEVIKTNPVLGTGFDTYKFMDRVGPYRDTHNYYVKVFLELGAVGLASFLMLLWVAGKMARQLYRSATEPVLAAIGGAFFAMLWCAAIVNFFGDRWTFLQVNGFLWVILGLVARGLYTVREQECAVEGVAAKDLYVSAELSHS